MREDYQHILVGAVTDGYDGSRRLACDENLDPGIARLDHMGVSGFDRQRDVEAGIADTIGYRGMMIRLMARSMAAGMVVGILMRKLEGEVPVIPETEDECPHTAEHHGQVCRDAREGLESIEVRSVEQGFHFVKPALSSSRMQYIKKICFTAPGVKRLGVIPQLSFSIGESAFVGPALQPLHSLDINTDQDYPDHRESQIENHHSEIILSSDSERPRDNS